VREDVIASAAEGQETTTLKCPYCSVTADYEVREFFRGPTHVKILNTRQITTASVTGPETVDGKLRYTFSRAIGYKG